MYFYPAFTSTLFPTLASTRGHSPTRVSPTRSSPVSIPASPPTARVQPPTRASPVSVPSSLLIAMLLYLPPFPTVWLSLTVASYSLIPTKKIPGLTEVFYLPPPGATIPLSCNHPPCSLSCLSILQISVTMLLTASWLPVVSLYSSSPNVFPLFLALLPPRASPMSYQIAVARISP